MNSLNLLVSTHQAVLLGVQAECLVGTHTGEIKWHVLLRIPVQVEESRSQRNAHVRHTGASAGGCHGTHSAH